MGNARRAIDPKSRLRVVRMIDDEGRDPRLVADILGVSHSLVEGWLRRYREGGPEALFSGKNSGRPNAFSEQQSEDLYLLLRNSSPREFGIDAALWNRAAVRLLIDHRFGMLLSPPTVSKILAGTGVNTMDSSLLREAAARDVLLETRAAQLGAKLLFGRVTSVGQSRRFAHDGPDHAISVVDRRGQITFFISSVPPTVDQLIDFGAGLLRDMARSLLVVVQDCPEPVLGELGEYFRVAGGRLNLGLLTRSGDGEGFVEV